jgi:hypothetical protein
VERWSAHAQESDGGNVDGVAARRLTADVDPVPALNELLGLAGQLGVPGQGKPIAGQEADGLRKLTKSAQLDVLVGKQDGLVRSLRLQFVFAADATQQLRSALGDLAAARLGVELRVDRPNQPIPPVTAPTPTP